MSTERPEMERSPDLLDRASAVTQRFNDDSVERARRLAQPEQTQNPDGTWPQTECDDCPNDIEEGRLAMGKIRCFGCQTALERRRKLGG